MYRICCSPRSSEENNVEDDIEGGIDAGCAPEALWHRVPVAAIEVEAPFRFFDGFAVVGVL